ncbi:MAG: type II toxin-antitoxin system HicA family toxin [Deltaproteobacteria bacterium]|nr:type II toxin-antitoxin system HicA family toxin [Deltaproteobacteria bacterium]
MSRVEKLYKKAINAPNNFPFQGLCSLAERVGFEFKRQDGSHRFYNHPGIGEVLNLQPLPKDSKTAKPYQVNQLLTIIAEHDLIKKDDKNG